jgi:tetratricopeptide (TPR) repeat protein
MDATTRIGFGVRAAAGLMLLAGLTGCMGHGKRTSEQISLAQQRMSQIKSATEWEMAEQAYFAGDLDRALEKVNNSIAMNPSVAKSHVLKGRIQLEQGQLEGARESLVRAEIISPQSEDANYFLGVVNERLSKKDAALERYMRAAEIDPEQALYAVAAAEVLIDLGRMDEAQTYLEDRSAIFEHNAGVRQTLGHLAMMRGDAARAVELFREARLLAPEDASMLEDLVIAQMQSGEFAEAEYGIAQLLRDEKNADRRDLLRMRARCLIELDRALEARETLLRLTGENGGEVDTESWLDLGALAYRMNDLTRLRQAGTQLVSIAPTRPEGYIYRAIWLRQHGDTRQALEVLEKGFAQSEMPVDAVLLRGVIEQDLGMNAAAARSFREAVAMNPDDSRAELLLGLLEQKSDGVASFPAE